MLIVSVLIVLSYFISGVSYSNSKRVPYECGLQSFSKLNINSLVQGYKLVVVYLLFEVEVLILVPLVIMGGSANWTLLHFCSFLGIVIMLFLGYIYEIALGLFEFIY